MKVALTLDEVRGSKGGAKGICDIRKADPDIG